MRSAEQSSDASHARDRREESQSAEDSDGLEDV